MKQQYAGTIRLGIEAIEWKVKGFSGAEIAKMYGVKPVSYTHLDVYKRHPVRSVHMCRLKPSLQREPESQPIRLIRPCLLYTSRCV